MKEDISGGECIANEHQSTPAESTATPNNNNNDNNDEENDDDEDDDHGDNNNNEQEESGEDGGDDSVEPNVEDEEGYEDNVAPDGAGDADDVSSAACDDTDVLRSLQKMLTKLGQQRHSACRLGQQQAGGRFEPCFLDAKKDKMTCWNPECTDESGLKTRKCFRCRLARCCGEECQSVMWPQHKSECKKLKKMKKIEKEIKDVKKRIECIVNL